MKRLLPIFVLTLFSVLGLHAEQLSVNDAIARAMQGNRRALKPEMLRSLQLCRTSSKGGKNLYYVFNRSNDGGFVILGADTQVPEVLAYTENGSFDESKMPPQLKVWLKEYDEAIAYALTTRSPLPSSANAKKVRANVSPLLTSRWGQDTDGSGDENNRVFNRLCPSGYDSETGEYGTAPVGCVATAATQIMYFHKYPARGKGSNRYYSSFARKYLDVSFNTYYDWNNMQDAYGYACSSDGSWKWTSYSSASADAVSKLAYDFGVAANMEYDYSASGTVTPYAEKALVDNFDYDPSVITEYRACYTDEEWEDLVHGELTAGRPLYYSACTAQYEGHAFVCDGYRNGLYHINWGWNGVSDGYYAIVGVDVLHPKEQGTGGSYNCDAFVYEHDIIRNIKPNEGGKFTPVMMISGTMATYDENKDEQNHFDNGDLVWLMPTSKDDGFFNHSRNTITVSVSLRLTDTKSDKTYDLAFQAGDELEPYYGFAGIPGTLKDIPDGIYTVTPIFKYVADGKVYPVKYPVAYKLPVIYVGDVEEPETDLGIVCTELVVVPHDNRQLEIQIVDLANLGDDSFKGDVVPHFYDANYDVLGFFDTPTVSAELGSFKYYSEALTWKKQLDTKNFPDGKYFVELVCKRSTDTKWQFVKYWSYDDYNGIEDKYPSASFTIKNGKITSNGTTTGVKSSVVKPSAGSEYWINPTIKIQDGRKILMHK